MSCQSVLSVSYHEVLTIWPSSEVRQCAFGLLVFRFTVGRHALERIKPSTLVNLAFFICQKIGIQHSIERAIM